MKKIVLACLLVAAALCLVSSGLYAAHSDYGCADCHQPHRVWDTTPGQVNEYGVPLFSTEMLKDGFISDYDPYSSKWFNAYMVPVVNNGQPTGASRLCLGCHDGTYGYVSHKFNKTNLKNSHPISVNYQTFLTAGAALYPTTELTSLGGSIAKDLLDQNGDIQCISCHDVHTTGKTEFLLKFEPGTGNLVLCRSCHIK